MCAPWSLSTMHFHKMPSWPQDALCSLNNKMHGIGGDGLAFQAARERQTLPSTRSSDDKRKSGILAWRVKLGSELHLFFTADDKHIQSCPLVQTLRSCF